MLEGMNQGPGARQDIALDAFLDAHPDCKLKSLTVGGQTVMMVEKDGLDLTNFALIESILAKQNTIETDSIFGNCFYIAADAVEEGSAARKTGSTILLGGGGWTKVELARLGENARKVRVVGNARELKKAVLISKNEIVS